ncbi:hypothetical protein TIFTF001_018783 [Ficus carica]|uniref:Uncharacterized protein n=1 Tax=Ficus carica TaxID=3494 RepID=A0AA88AVX8_FICCA|nr:hypothetical protein TIFTF001_018783 [Ficus carica]
MYQPCTIMLCLVTYEREAPWSKRDTDVVSAKGTPMLKSVRDTNEQSKKQSFNKENLSIPEGYGCQPIRDDVAEAVWADHTARDLVMVGEVLLGPVSQSPMVICKRLSKESFSEKMSDLSGDSENNNLSIEVDITGSSESTDSFDSTDHTTNSTEQVRRTLDNLSGISDIPTLRVEWCAGLQETKGVNRSLGGGPDQERGHSRDQNSYAAEYI